MLNIVIPMAGRGSRFANAGYVDPKPLIKVNGKEMIRLVIGNLKPACEHRFIFMCLQEHIDKYDVDKKLAEWCPGCIVIPVKTVTEGAACTVLLAEKYIDSEDPLMIANSDQWVDIDINKYLNSADGASGLIMTMKADDPKWSFVKFDTNGKVCEVVEKKVVSDEATVGIYNFAHGSDYVKYAHKMIAADLRVNGEFYVAPVYNQLIADKGEIHIYNIGTDVNGMYGLGIPEDLNYFLTLSVCKRAIEKSV
jgi:dTDP-glucose pyrophosphorylase